ncbi:cytochrome P450 [Streptomyces sp. NPDC055078]
MKRIIDGQNPFHLPGINLVLPVRRRPECPTAPGALPFLGHSGRMARDPLGFFESLRPLGPLVRIRLGHTTSYVATTAELARQILVAGNGVEFDKGGPYFASFRQVLGDGLATIGAEEHRPLWTMLRPAFQSARMPDYAERFRDCAQELSRSFRPGQVIDADEAMNRLAIDILARTLFPAPEDHEAIEVFQRNIPAILSNLVTRMLLPGGGRLPLPGNIRFTRATAEIQAAISAMVRRRERDLTDHGDLLSLLMPPGRPCERSDREMFEHVMSFFIGGTETAASLLAWSLHLLSRHPAPYRRLEAELDEVLGHKDVSYRDLAHLTYMRCVLNEALRLYPPGWLLSRATLTSTLLAGYRLPPGTGVFFSPYTFQRDPSVFVQPDRFDPDRWSAERLGPEQKAAFMPFGLGARRCIGEAFGIAESQMALAVLLRRWRVRALDGAGVKPVARMTMHPSGVRLRLERRDVTA